MTRRRSPCAASMPSSASRTTASGSLISFFTSSLLSGTGHFPRGHRIRGRGRGSIHGRRGGLLVGLRAQHHTAVEAQGRLAGVARLELLERGVHEEHVVGRLLVLLAGAEALAIPERTHLRHHLAALRLVARADRPAEADLDLVAPAEEAAGPALGPVLARGHGVVGAADVDRDDVDVVVGGDDRCAGADLADLAV